MKLELPVRVDFLGGWTDQECWPDFGCVLNAAIGWDGQYPLSLSGDGRWESVVPGEGTGLGISSIRHAAQYMLCTDPGWSYRVTDDPDFPWGSDENRAATEAHHPSLAVAASVHAERETTRGGWQDAAGALYPGIKCVGGLWPDLKVLAIPPGFRGGAIADAFVLFDTGERRDSASIGEQVRYLIGEGDKTLCDILRLSAEDAPAALFSLTGYSAAVGYVIPAWNALCERVPGMRGPKVPIPHGAWGYKLCGAGGGGYGMMFCEPDDREEVRDNLRANGYWATIPELLPGPRWVSEPAPKATLRYRMVTP